jgi:hypothetical protein
VIASSVLDLAFVNNSFAHCPQLFLLSPSSDHRNLQHTCMRVREAAGRQGRGVEGLLPLGTT